MFKTYQQILAELLAALQTNTNITDVQPGSLAYTLMAVVARALRGVWFMLEQMTKLFFVSSSSGSFLERRCNERGVFRKIGTPASGEVLFTRSSPSPIGITLKQGTLLATMDGKIEFVVLQDVPLPQGWASVVAPVTCISIGRAGNLAAGTPLQVVGITVMGVQNVTVGDGGLTGGVDTESDEDLRARYLFVIRNPQNGGTAADYLVWAMEVQGVVHAIPLPLNRGPGTVDVVVSDGSIPSDELVQTVTDHIETKRPVGADVLVLKPVAHSIDIAATVTASTGYTIDALDISVKQAITNYLGSIPIGGVIRVAGIYQAAMAVPGVLDFTLLSPVSNIQLESTEMATVGALAVA
ncbi:baseplate J/gp47 family protein [Tumebacillus sp. ITR2]|uniref:Baseplate J/gp47 family protein n=1 Tax=Tumebacillus amylolyticus TaxID=2801339 RepID=A0ABS1JCF7_9BACL|nr:baseplate J/gp47 family protein [Tumebacillus amylolyticus]MBL0387930.1 baseplate J/gp47 family protein [Tumebacillus amylolyticus]